jgi:phosphoglycerate dehydrogenase-like enzyme
MKQASFFTDRPETIPYVYGNGRQEKICSLARLHPTVVNRHNFSQEVTGLGDLEVIFSTWGMPRLESAQLDRLPRLQAVFYAAGSVRDFAGPMLERNITVVSAWAANAKPTALFAYSQIILALKGFFRNRREFTGPDQHAKAWRGPGTLHSTVAILGTGQVGRLVLEQLRPLDLQVLVVSPHTDAATIRSLGGEKVELAEAFARSSVVSNHIADLPETVGLLNRNLFASMPPGATFINTGRGRTVCEKGLMDVFSKRQDLTALLDVTHPEPPAAGSPLYSLPNVEMSTHIAGSTGQEVIRMADCVISEFESWLAGKPLRYSVSRSMLATMA